MAPPSALFTLFHRQKSLAQRVPAAGWTLPAYNMGIARVPIASELRVSRLLRVCFPIASANGSERFEKVIGVEEEGYFSESDEADFVLRACGMGARCEVMDAKVVHHDCEDR